MTISRDEAHKLLDQLLDTIENERTANDPEAQAAAEQQAVALFGNLAKTLMGDVFAIRRGAAVEMFDQPKEESTAGARIRRGRAYLRTKGNRPTALWELSSLSGNEASQARNAIARAALDAEAGGLFQAGVGTALFTALNHANMGTVIYGEFFWPPKKQGQGLPDANVAAFTAIARDAYYIAGYRDQGVEISLDRVKRKLGLAVEWDAFRKRLARDRIQGLKAMCLAAQKCGASDRAAGRPEAPPNGDVPVAILRQLYLGREP